MNTHYSMTMFASGAASTTSGTLSRDVSDYTGYYLQYDPSPRKSCIVNTLCKASHKRHRRIRRIARALPAPDIAGGWMLDTGTTYHLQNTAEVKDADLTPLAKSVPVRTANGIVHMTNGAQIEIPSLGKSGSLMTRPLDNCPQCALGRQACARAAV